jgi:hypothetical protein
MTAKRLIAGPGPSDRARHRTLESDRLPEEVPQMKTIRPPQKLRLVAVIASALACSMAAEVPAAEAIGEPARKPSRRVERTTSLHWMSDVAARLAVLEVHAGERAARAVLARSRQPSTTTRTGERP